MYNTKIYIKRNLLYPSLSWGCTLSKSRECVLPESGLSKDRVLPKSGLSKERVLPKSGLSRGRSLFNLRFDEGSAGGYERLFDVDPAGGYERLFDEGSADGYEASSVYKKFTFFWLNFCV